MYSFASMGTSLGRRDPSIIPRLPPPVDRNRIRPPHGQPRRSGSGSHPSAPRGDLLSWRRTRPARLATDRRHAAAGPDPGTRKEGPRMPLFGAHMSVAGGLHEALLTAQRYDCQTVQLFTKNANQWNAPDLAPDKVELFRQTLLATRLRFPIAHDSYLINLASPDHALRAKSLDAFTKELQRAEQLGLSYLVTHPGAHLGEGEDAGL